MTLMTQAAVIGLGLDSRVFLFLTLAMSIVPLTVNNTINLITLVSQLSNFSFIKY